MAARNLNLPDGAVFYSDRGSNYTSAEFAAVLERLGVWQSVGRTGIVDNALAESFNAAVEVERVHLTVYPTRKKAKVRLPGTSSSGTIGRVSIQISATGLRKKSIRGSNRQLAA